MPVVGFAGWSWHDRLAAVWLVKVRGKGQFSCGDCNIWGPQSSSAQPDWMILFVDPSTFQTIDGGAYVFSEEPNVSKLGSVIEVHH